MVLDYGRFGRLQLNVSCHIPTVQFFVSSFSVVPSRHLIEGQLSEPWVLALYYRRLKTHSDININMHIKFNGK